MDGGRENREEFGNITAGVTSKIASHTRAKWRGKMKLTVPHRKWRYRGSGALVLVSTLEYYKVMKRLDKFNIKKFTHKIIQKPNELLRDGTVYDQISIETY